MSTHHPSKRHPLTVGHLRWALPLAGLAFGLAAGFGIVQIKHAVAGTYQQHLTHVRAVKAGETAKSDLFEMTFSDVSSVATDAAFVPADGDDIVIVTLKLKNRTDASLNFFPSVMTYIRDDQGNTFMMHPTLAMTNPLPGGAIAAGQTVTGQLSYEIPKNLHDFRLYIDPAWRQMVPVVAQLSR